MVVSVPATLPIWRLLYASSEGSVWSVSDCILSVPFVQLVFSAVISEPEYVALAPSRSTVFAPDIKMPPVLFHAPATLISLPFRSSVPATIVTPAQVTSAGSVNVPPSPFILIVALV